ncbi:MAG: hypothetical protein PHE89_04495 [Alphaproteobacteria bacterium]|nr:hypothetical protein [Alphaproteobacteria bacterium]
MKKFTFMLALGLLFSAQAKADDLYTTMSEICSDEIAKYCVNDENYAVVDCLRKSTDNLSAGCVIAVSSFDGVTGETYESWISMSQEQRQQQYNTGYVGSAVEEYMETSDTE